MVSPRPGLTLRSEAGPAASVLDAEDNGRSTRSPELRRAGCTADMPPRKLDQRLQRAYDLQRLYDYAVPRRVTWSPACSERSPSPSLR
jgi:hypothetical protein